MNVIFYLFLLEKYKRVNSLKKINLWRLKTLMTFKEMLFSTWFVWFHLNRILRSCRSLGDCKKVIFPNYFLHDNVV